MKDWSGLEPSLYERRRLAVVDVPRGRTAFGVALERGLCLGDDGAGAGAGGGTRAGGAGGGVVRGCHRGSEGAGSERKACGGGLRPVDERGEGRERLLDVVLAGAGALDRGLCAAPSVYLRPSTAAAAADARARRDGGGRVRGLLGLKRGDEKDGGAAVGATRRLLPGARARAARARWRRPLRRGPRRGSCSSGRDSSEGEEGGAVAGREVVVRRRVRLRWSRGAPTM